MVEKQDITKSVFEHNVTNLLILYGGHPFEVTFKIIPSEGENTVELVSSEKV